jgi:undecaprenyl pyrophosphate phosphatase UppP
VGVQNLLQRKIASRLGFFLIMPIITDSACLFRFKTGNAIQLKIDDWLYATAMPIK